MYWDQRPQFDTTAKLLEDKTVPYKIKDIVVCSNGISGYYSICLAIKAYNKPLGLNKS